MFVFWLLAFDFIYLLKFISCLLFNFVYFRFELFLMSWFYFFELCVSVCVLFLGCFLLCKLKSIAAAWSDNLRCIF